ncbi:sulfotransferase 1E1-like [Haliotis rufescens]|uniref:sulfotransferase 1E1-like n=1 Tax=Haliotis rufescens TaxID=6454 RepID=UPI00201EB2E1|nr:sulfotransferase 1E1-like [Haliotis rufescens]
MGTGEKLVLMRTTKGQPIYYLQKDGVLYPPLPDYSTHLKNVKNFRCQPDDVWICGYPKSGNHWIWEVVQMILKGKAEFATEFMEKFLVDFESLDSPFLMSKSRRILVSHLPRKHVPYSMFQKGIKIIYVVRNPKDVAVSAYNHLSSVTEDFRQISFSEYLALQLQGKVYYGDWYDHVTGWTQAALANPNILIVKYEDMKRDLYREVRRVAGFLRQNPGEQTIENIATACTFENMKGKKTECKDKWREDGLISSVYRKGEVGDWRNWFTPEESREFDEKHRRKMASCKLNVDFILDAD